MTDVEDFEAHIAQIRAALQATYKAKGRDLAQALKRTGRRLPRGHRKSGEHLVKIQSMLGHPRLERMVDFAAARADAERLLEYLDGLDVDAIRQRRLLGMFGLVAFYVLFSAGAFVLWMIWAGQI